VAKIPALSNLEMKNAWTVLKFKDGKVNVDPTDVKFGNGYNINFKGANGFDQSIDYDVRLDVPGKELGAATSLAQGMLAKVPGLSGAMPDVVGFLFGVTGTAAKPKVTLKGVNAGGGSAKDMVTNAAEDLKKKAEEEAKKQAEELKKKAEDELNKQKQAAQQAADKAKKEAEQKAKEAADKAKKEAEQKLKDVFKFPK
jgi:vacuolar-type H+-ATPase subunit H